MPNPNPSSEAFVQALTALLVKHIETSNNNASKSITQFVSELIASLSVSSKHLPNAMGPAFLQVLAYELLEYVADDSQSTQSLDGEQEVPKVDTATTATRFSGRDSTSAVIEVPASFNDKSPLMQMGYSVAEDGPDDASRRQILSLALNSNSTHFSSDAQLARYWGEPSSNQRLYAISKFLAWLVRFQGAEKAMAAFVWRSDLAWLKETYYTPAMDFVWPETDSAAKQPKRTPNPAFMKALTPSDALARVVGAKPLPRTEIVTRLWAYVKKNKLQDKLNKRMINADDQLFIVFGKRQVSMFELAALIGKHVK